MSRVRRALLRCSMVLFCLATWACQAGPPEDLLPVELEDGHFEVVGWIIATLTVSRFVATSYRVTHLCAEAKGSSSTESIQLGSQEHRLREV